MKRVGKFILKTIGVLLGLALVAFVVLYLMYNKPLPEGKMGPEAEALAQKMLRAVNKEAWDATNIVEWTFIGQHHFLWDRKRHLVRVEWGNWEVLLNPNTMDGKIYKNGVEQEKDQATLDQAYGYFINDAFWMNGFTQIYNGNPEHRLVKMEDDTEALLVTYPTGGVTPGDSYLWILDENGLPKAWQMWVGVLPIGGIEVSWENWETLPSGAKLAADHNMAFFNVAITNIRAYESFEKGGFEEDVFVAIVQ